MDTSQTIHATCVAVGGTGVLLLGPPGAGKSDLALRLIDEAGQAIGGQRLVSILVADDQVRLTAEDGRLYAASPDSIAGRIEVRGLGIVNTPFQPSVPVGLAVELAGNDKIDRMPDPAGRFVALGVSVPMVTINPHEASASARVRAAVLHSGRK